MRPPGVTPWEPGHQIQIQSQGGIINKERRRYTIVGHGEYHHHVAKHRDVTVHTGQRLTYSKSQTVVLKPPKDTAGLSADWGKDSLEVEGDARIESHSRTLMMSGLVSRRWDGGVVRLASMEGVICAGAYSRTLAGGSANLSPLCSGDVYGGVARVSINRSMLAVLHYRANAAAAWACGIYVRTANFVVEPMVSAPSSPGPKGRIMEKLARLNKVADAARMVLPPLDILMGVLTAVPMLVWGLGRGAYSMIKPAPIQVPPAGPPRVHNRMVGFNMQCFSAMLYL